jgi:hypothetical protein
VVNTSENHVCTLDPGAAVQVCSGGPLATAWLGSSMLLARADSYLASSALRSTTRRLGIDSVTSE